ncbi:MAG: mandelate racemase/muconate lactonizing enzyme family protein [Halobacteriales archaeon]|nr:mandelate racemase/muconate lactonizing enzyme family protein [Halobacteriales archaeon]
MEITTVETFLVGPPEGKNFCFVRVETDEGIHGWGECYTQADRDIQIESHVQKLERYLIGRDPQHIKHFLQVAYDDFAARRGAMDFYSAISGIEQALWDITGKRLDVPVHTLLGGACRAEIPVYANGWPFGLETAEEFADAASEVVDAGFNALKFDPVPGPWRTYVDSDIEDAAIENVRAVRQAVGPDVDILVEIHRRLAPMHAERIARGIREYDPFWFEEPVLAENLDALATVREHVDIPIVTGEELYTKFEFREAFEKGAADIINPDVCNTGGILELKEIGAMAEPYFVAVSPHNYNSTTVGLAATLQVAAVMPNFLITEYFVNFEAVGEAIAEDPFSVENSAIALPEGPGLGIELDVDALADYPYREEPARSIRHYDEE